jgi:hypothetical protein
MTRVESQQLAELDRVDHLEQDLASASKHAAQQLKLHDARIRSQQLAALDRVDQLEQELRSAQECAAQRLDRICALEEALERIEATRTAGEEPEDHLHEPKFYAVHAGRKPGVYTSWKEAKREVDGFTGAHHKRFSDYMSAAEFVSTGTATSRYEYYGVRKGRSTGVYTSSAAARLQD